MFRLCVMIVRAINAGAALCRQLTHLAAEIGVSIDRFDSPVDLVYLSVAASPLTVCTEADGSAINLEMGAQSFSGPALHLQ